MLDKVWHSRAILEHLSEFEICQSTDNLDFKLDCVRYVSKEVLSTGFMF